MTSSVLLDNRYKVIHSLASGGFGATYLAADTRVPSQRQCVVKQLKPITQDPNLYAFVKERFTREAVVLEELGHHPQIPQLYAYFEEDGQFYLVQEYIQGKTLAQQLEWQGPWSESDARQLLDQLLPVLAFIHKRGIIHRDIKPENIILQPGDLLPVLIDFGAVKEALNTQVAKVGHVEPSVVIGTTGFMPPEQAIGHPVFSSDLYALSLTVIYCLTGQRPQAFQNDPMSGEILWQRHLPDLNPTLTAVLTQAVRPTPTARFTTAPAMIAALAVTESGTPLSSPVVATTHVPASAIPTIESQATAVVSPRESERHRNQGLSTPLDSATMTSVDEQLFGARKTSTKGLKWMLFGLVLGLIAIASGLITLMVQRGANVSLTGNTAEEPGSAEGAPPATVAPPETENPDTIVPGDWVKEPVTTPESLSISAAKTTVEQFYTHLSNQAFREAQALMSPALAEKFDPEFFKQFQRVSVENLKVSSQTLESVELVGQNTYYYYDGTTQQEERTFVIQQIDQDLRIVKSDFVKVVKPR